MAAPIPVPEDYSQPALPTTKSGWAINSIDLQILSKQNGWNQDATKRANEYQEMANIGGVNYVALACPYNNLTKYTNYVTDARTKGFKVWHRSHWDLWQGDNVYADSAMTVAISNSSTTATLTSTVTAGGAALDHGFVVGEKILVSGATQGAYNGEFTVVTVPTTNTLTYTMASDPGGAATGTPRLRMPRQTYLDKTYDFIINNSTLFQAGDLFGLCVECNTADNNSNWTFRTGSVSSGAFNYTTYNRFLRDQVVYANWAFGHVSGLQGQIHTWPISLGVSNLNLNGQSVNVGGSESSGNSSGLGDADLVAYFAGRVTLDHYIDSSVTDGPTYYTDYNSDLDKFNLAFPSCKLFIGEWGFHTQADYGEGVQYGVYDRACLALRNKSFVIGVNFWNHMGQLQSSIWNDNSGTVVKGGRKAVDALRLAFNAGNKAYGMRVRV